MLTVGLSHIGGFPGAQMVKNLPGGGNGSPLQYSYLENSTDRGAWWATVHGVTKSWTQLSDSYIEFIMLNCVPSAPSSLSSFYYKWILNFVTFFFCICQNDFMIFLYLILLIWMFISIPTLGKLSAIAFSSKLSARFSLSSPPAPLSCEHWSTWCFPINPLSYLFFSLFSSLFALLIGWVSLPVLWFLWFFFFLYLICC